MSSELSMFPMQPLDSVIKKRNQGVNTTTEKVAYSSCGIPVIRSKNIKNNRIDFSDVVYVDQKTYEGLKDTCKPKLGDILFTNIGEIGNSAVVETDEIFIVAWNVLRVQPNEKVNNHYLSYVLSEREVKGKMNSLNSSSTLPFVSGKEFGKVEIPLPTLDRQKSIVEILKPIDNRINLLRETNTTLEAIAQALFKSWFVDFDPVHAKMQGRSPEGMDEAIGALFPDSLEESELGSLPMGWRVDEIGNVVKISYGKNLPTSKLLDTGYSVYGGNGLIGFSDKFLYESRQVLVACRGAASGKFNQSVPRSFVTNNSLVLESSDTTLLPFGYLKGCISSADLTPFVTGSAQPQVTIDNLRNFKLLIPSASTLTAFEFFSSSIEVKIEENNHQVRTLENLRDALLPGLISGSLQLTSSSLTAGL